MNPFHNARVSNLGSLVGRWSKLSKDRRNEFTHNMEEGIQ